MVHAIGRLVAPTHNYYRKMPLLFIHSLSSLLLLFLFHHFRAKSSPILLPLVVGPHSLQVFFGRTPFTGNFSRVLWRVPSFVAMCRKWKKKKKMTESPFPFLLILNAYHHRLRENSLCVNVTYWVWAVLIVITKEGKWESGTKSKKEHERPRERVRVKQPLFKLFVK